MNQMNPNLNGLIFWVQTGYVSFIGFVYYCAGVIVKRRRFVIKAHKHKVLYLLLLILALVTVGALLERGVRDSHNRTVGPKKILKLAFKTSSLDKISVCLCSPDREVRIVRGDGLVTGGSIFEGAGPGRKPGILLIHGNTGLGRRLAMYPVLGSKLAENGYVVLTLDLPGFGESDDPYSLGTPEALDEFKTVEAAVQYMIKNMSVSTENLTVIGHSRGTVMALDAALNLEEVRKIILIGPVRRWRQRFADLGDRAYFWRRAQETHRFVYGTPFPDWYTADIWNKRVEKFAMEYYLEYFSREGHKPVMFVDGELEGQSDKLYLEKYYAAIEEPKKLVRLKRSDHYSNTAQSMGVIFYDKDVMEQLVHEITQWLEFS